MMNFLPLLWPCLCLVGGFVFLVVAIVLRRTLKSSESWPKTAGVITESSIQSGWDGSGSNRVYVVRPKVVYEYQVQGQKYHSSQLALEEFNTSNENSAREKSEKYPVGREVEVYYDPKNPDFATLQIGDPSKGMLPFGIAMVGAIQAVAGIVWLIRLHK